MNWPIFFRQRAEAASPPDAPSSLAANAVSDTRIDTSWTDNSDDEVDFEHQRALDSGFTSGLTTVIKGANVVSHSWTGLAASTQYFFRVRARNAAGESAWSNIANATTDAEPEDPPNTPTGLGTTTVSSGRVDLSWNAGAGGGSVDNYRVQRNGMTIGTPTGTSFSDTTAAEGTCYDYRVRAEGPGGNSSYTATEQGCTKHATPGLTGCCDGPDCGNPIGVNKTYRLNIVDNAANNTAIKVFRNGSLYDTIGQGTQTYTPADQNDDVGWHVTASGGGAPESANSPTRTTPFSGSC